MQLQITFSHLERGPAKSISCVVIFAFVNFPVNILGRYIAAKKYYSKSKFRLHNVISVMLQGKNDSK